jgi:uncharacterized membrane-anchored protein
MRWRSIVIGVALLAALAWVGWQVAAKERLAATGRPVLFELAPVDPRSLIQGDYMRLRYGVVEDLAQQGGSELPSVGKLLVTVDADGVAREARLYKPGQPVGADAVLVDYHRGGWQLSVGPDSFFFQEGEAAAFQAARYAELRLSPTGESLLVSLRDSSRELIGRPALR